MKVEIKEWNEIKDSFLKGGLLLGNGASIAISNSFNYTHLKNHSKENGYLDESVDSLFSSFKTSDFEFILRIVWHAYSVNKALNVQDKKTENSYLSIRDALIKSVRDIHCKYEDIQSKFKNMYIFSKEFSTICSLNYDLILYWLAMYGNEKEKDGHVFKDCFNNKEFDSNIEKFREPIKDRGENKCTLFFYPHGNLVFLRNIHGEEIKIKNKDNINLLETILDEWRKNERIPLFVSEGTGHKKLESIQSSFYLNTIYNNVLPKMGESLVIYGWGMKEEDNHIINKICSGNIKKFAVSVFINGNEQEYCNDVKNVINKYSQNPEILFFNSVSKGCWIN